MVLNSAPNDAFFNGILYLQQRIKRLRQSNQLKGTLHEAVKNK